MKYIEATNSQDNLIRFSEENLIDRIISTGRHCIIHGFAGSGKSTLIRRLAELLGDKCLKLAPTGNTAYNIDGSTIDSLISCFRRSPNSTLKKLELYDFIVLDEISMVHSFKLEFLFNIMDCLNKISKKIKLILIGDPFQLPPVVRDDMKRAFSKKAGMQMDYDDFYFFNSKRFQDSFNNMDCILLDKNYRFTDTRYETVQRKIALGSANQDDLEYLNQKVITYDLFSSVNEHPIILPTRNGANIFNNHYLETLGQKFSSVPNVEWITTGYSDIEFEYDFLLEPLDYSIDSPIVFTQNDLNKQWVNGTKGVIHNIYWDDYGNTYLQIMTDRNEYLRCTQTLHRLQRLVFKLESNTIENETVAVIRQFPFILGYAVTVHRAQGMTLDSMAFNTGEGLFSPGQLYVALSRVRKLDDLTLHVPLRKVDIITSNQVKAYFDAFTKRCITV
ncbi:MAG: AAA family ATPase [Clostridiales bacterium]|jgi:ATP-dependent exoDNAse (exonuclease V) alpha subunit|nr:AAA family ATPase [Clostridiales bacterium]